MLSNATFNRLISNWVHGGFLAGILILCLRPVFARGWPQALLSAFLSLPAYMLHQYEEHDNDRFRTFVNRLIGRGREVLTPLAVFLTNVIGVWSGLLWALLSGSPRGSISVAVSSLLTCCSMPSSTSCKPLPRTYNPGRVTAIALFLPLGW